MTDGAWEGRPAGSGYADLSPLSILLRSARVFADSTAIVDGARRRSYAELLGEVERLARPPARRSAGLR